MKQTTTSKRHERKITVSRLHRAKNFPATIVAKSKSLTYLCNAFHFNSEAAKSPISIPAAFFMPAGLSLISSVPCGALMRPLPQIQGGKQRGAELFTSLLNKIYYQSINAFKQ